MRPITFVKRRDGRRLSCFRRFLLRCAVEAAPPHGAATRLSAAATQQAGRQLSFSSHWRLGAGESRTSHAQSP